MSPALFSQGDDRFHLPTGDAKVAFVDCRDIAICAAAILADPDKGAAFAGKAFELTGPEAITVADIATTLSLVAGREIADTDGMEAFCAHAAELGVSDMIKGVYDEAAGGWFGEVSDASFVQATGRHPTSFARFAFDHQAFFAAPA